MRKAGATEEDINTYKWGLLGNDLLGPDKTYPIDLVCPTGLLLDR